MSSNELTSPLRLSANDLGRQLLVIWQDPETRIFQPIGTLSVQDGEYAFAYHPAANRRLAAFPVDAPTLVGRNLPAFFANRVLDPRQPSFGEYIAAFDLSEPVSPVELLVRSAGRRVTDTFQVVEFPRFNEQGSARLHYFVSAVRHIGEESAISSLNQGEELRVVSEPQNPVNSAACRLESELGIIGYVPDWQLPLLRQVQSSDGSLSVHVVRVNPASQGSHLRVLASLDLALPQGVQVDSDCLFESERVDVINA